jgi:hypothetical protein
MNNKNKKYSNYFKSSTKIKLKEQTIFGNVQVVQQEEVPDNIDINNILKKIELIIPGHFVQNLDGIYFGTYDFLLKRDLNALYKDGVIYVLPQQDDDKDIFDDIVHEIAHCVEETYGYDLYEDGAIESEFLRKRRAMLDLLRQHGYNEVPESMFYESDYNEKFDQFLYLIVGYPNLQQIMPNLFCTPYGATSLREYFANGFEEFFAKRKYNKVKDTSPSVYEKIEILLGI